MIVSDIDLLDRKLSMAGHPDKALQMSAYMKNRFLFHGVQAKPRREVFRAFIKEVGLPDVEDLGAVVFECFAKEGRELQYCGVDLCDRMKKKVGREWIEQIEELITLKSWWDTVDGLAVLAGKHFMRFPELMKAVTSRWNQHENMWLQRSSIIFQLTYKEETHWDLMQEYILRHVGSKEFFIQKAQGWALRQYSKVAPDAVSRFLEENPGLSPLTRREASKYV
jgi:3-methyladenine DNA glycosylase AlkD